MRFAVHNLLTPLAGALVVACGAIQPADVYPIPIEQAYDKLVDVDFGPLSEGEKALDTEKTASGNGRDKVTWVHKGDMAYYKCKLGLKALPEDAARTHVTVTCEGGGAGDGAAAGLARNFYRQRIIERVDATLTDRPFDASRAGATAYRWPEDVEGELAAQKNADEFEERLDRLQAEARRAQLDAEAFGTRMN